MQNFNLAFIAVRVAAKGNAARVSLWRKLKKYGAIQLKRSAYVLA